jgi:YidC/Oxa1 family membrane protein insertase
MENPAQKNKQTLIFFLVLIVIMSIAKTLLPKPPVKKPQEQSRELAKDLAIATATPVLTRDVIADNARVEFENEKIKGSINLASGAIDNLTLKSYSQKLGESEKVELFLPKGASNQYYASFGWLGENIALPPSFKAIGSKLTPKTPITLEYTSGENITYRKIISLTNDYRFNIKMQVENKSATAVKLYEYGAISRSVDMKEHSKSAFEMATFTGALVSNGGIVEDLKYAKLAKKGDYSVEGRNLDWLSITDNYWFASIMPQKGNYTTKLSSLASGKDTIFQADFRSDAKTVAPNTTITSEYNLYAGAKDVASMNETGIKNFDKNIDYGWFYFITKPMYAVLRWLYQHLGNFGLAILGLTIIVKLIMLPVMNKSYRSMASMKKIMPKVNELKAQFKGDNMRLQKEMMALYKKEKVNPAAGCLPLLLTIPVFFALYKVIMIAIDMRHAPFYWQWLDLSAGDPTNILTLFGLLSFKLPFAVPLLPVLYGVTMYFQQKQTASQITDEAQKMVMKYMPWLMAFLFSGFASGLVLYWVWNNILSILQQHYINKRIAKL